MINEFELLKNNNKCLIELKNKRIFLTGATGLIGSYFVNFIYYLNNKYNYGIKLYCFIRNIGKVETKLRECEFIKWYLNDDYLDNEYDYILHFASPTKSKTFVNDTINVLDFMYSSTLKLLKLANRCNATFLYLSSIEAYGEINSDLLINENIPSQISSNNIRNCYPIGKLISENLAFAFNSQFGTQIRIARLTQIIGTVAGDNRFISYLVNSIKNNKDISLNTYGKTKKSYCYIMDAISAIIYILIKGSNEIYNIANENIKMSIYDLANFVSKKYLNKNVSIHIKEGCGYPNDTSIFLDSSKLLKLGWKPLFDLEQSFNQMIE